MCSVKNGTGEEASSPEVIGTTKMRLLAKYGVVAVGSGYIFSQPFPNTE